MQILLAVLGTVFLWALQGKLLRGEPAWIGWVIAPLWLVLAAALSPALAQRRDLRQARRAAAA